ncbi:MAG: hypothetical protein J6T73_03650, partial [Clostridia bacterium]|nr:hypothetical protein [Clostridia bacterium]
MKMNLKQNKLVSVLLAVTIMLTVVLLPVMTVFAMTDDDTWAIQVTREGGPNGEKIDYSGYDWSSLGKNLIPDPTVSHFDVNGEYGRYAKLGVDGNPVDIDTYYWGDKPTNTQDGF